MDIFRVNSRPTSQGNSDHFTGHVTADLIISTSDPARVRALQVAFAPGARTAWHTHPLGQTLFVISGVGRVQKQGEPIQEIRPGDTVWIPPGEVHWHGATPDHSMCHIAIHEALNGTNVDWLEHVTDAEYDGPVE